MDSTSLSFIVLMVVVMGGMMWWQSKKAKEQQKKVKDFRSNLQPGTEVITIGQIIGKVVSVDEQYEEVVIDSEGSKLRVGFNAISREYVRPAYVSDDEVDEHGNPIADPAAQDAEPSQTEAETPAQAEAVAQSKSEPESTDADKETK